MPDALFDINSFIMTRGFCTARRLQSGGGIEKRRLK